MRKADGLLKMEIVMFLRTVNLGTFGKDKSKLGISVVNLGELCVLIFISYHLQLCHKTVQGYSVSRRYSASHYAGGIESSRFRALLMDYYY